MSQKNAPLVDGRLMVSVIMRRVEHEMLEHKCFESMCNLTVVEMISSVVW